MWLTALLGASKHGHITTVKLLLESRADIDHRDKVTRSWTRGWSVEQWQQCMEELVVKTFVTL